MHNRRNDVLSKAARIALIAGCAVSLAAPIALAGPRGERVQRGSAEFIRNGDTTIIRAADRTIINYSSFDITGDQTVRFIQPSADARVLNRINGAAPTRIDGVLQANGLVYIVNPAGVIFGANAFVDVGGIHAAAGAITDRDFLRGIDRFTGLSGEVINHGHIQGGAIHLLGQRVANHGAIVADRGVVTMLSGNDIYIGERGGQIFVRIDGETLNADAKPGRGDGRVVSAADTPAVENTGSVQATGGRVSLGAGDAYSLAVRNTGSISASGGAVALTARDGAIHNSGELSASVAEGQAGAVSVRAPQIVHSGVASADAERGAAGSVEITSSLRTTLTDGSVVSAAGLGGHADGGTVLVHAWEGDTLFARGAQVDISGGALGGHGGFVEISATERLGAHGSIKGDVKFGYDASTALFDPRDIFIINDPGMNDGDISGDGSVGAGDGGMDDFFISRAAIEGFAGDVFLEATRDIYLATDIEKVNGGLSLLAFNDIIMGIDIGGVTAKNASASFLNFTAGRDIIDVSPDLFGMTLTASAGDLTLEATTGSIQFGRIGVPAGQTIFLTQAESMAIGAGPGGFVFNPVETNFVVNITDGSLLLGGNFGGFSSQTVASFDGFASESLTVEEGLTVASFADLRAGLDINIDGFLHAQDFISLHAGMTGAGQLAFLSPGLDLGANQIALRSGNNSGLGAASVNAITNAPIFRGAALGSTRPNSFSIIQDASLSNTAIPQPTQFGSSVAGMSYRLESSDGAVSVMTPNRVAGSALTLASQTGSNINGELSLASLLVLGPAFINQDVTTTGNQTYAGAATLTGDRTLTGDAIAFNGGATGDSLTIIGALTGSNVTLSGDGAFQGVTLTGDLDIGDGAIFDGAVAAASVNVDGLTALNGGAVTTTGAQSYGGVDLGADAVLEAGGAIAFGGPVNGGFGLEIDADGLTTFSGPVGADAALASLAITGAAAVNGAGVETTGAQLYGAGVSLGGETTNFTGDFITFSQSLDGASDVSINGDALFAGLVGMGTPLASLTVNGETTIAGSGVYTMGDQTYGGALTLDDHTSLTSLDDGVIRFASSVNGGFDLAVTTTPGGLIVFEGDVGAIERLRDLFLSTAGDSAARPVPNQATIFGDGSIDFFVRDFVMGQNEKFTIFGDLGVFADRAAFLGDLTTTGDMLVVAPTINLLRRLPGSVLTSDGSTLTDRGLDFVAGGVIDLDGEIVLAGVSTGSDPTFASAVTGEATPRLAAFEFTLIESELTTEDTLTFDDVVLDQLTMAPTPPPDDDDFDPAPDLAGAEPITPEFEDTTIPEVFDLQLLQRIAIAARNVGPGESQDAAGSRRALYTDLPASPEGFTDAELTSVASRFDRGIVQRVVNTYNGIFGDEDERVDDVIASIEQARETYFSLTDAAEIDPQRFRTMLHEQDDLATANAYVNDLQRLLDELRWLGLTPGEYRQTRARLLGVVASAEGLTVEQLTRVLEATPPAPEPPVGAGT